MFAINNFEQILWGATIPLNGGSDTRTGIIEYYFDLAKLAQVEYRLYGRHTIKILPSPNNKKGLRYCAFKNNKTLTWLNYRKSKKLQRKNLIREL